MFCKLELASLSVGLLGSDVGTDPALILHALFGRLWVVNVNLKILNVFHLLVVKQMHLKFQQADLWFNKNDWEWVCNDMRATLKLVFFR